MPSPAVERVVYRDPVASRRKTVLLTEVREAPGTFDPAPHLHGTLVDKDGVKADPPRKFLAQHGADHGEVHHQIPLKCVVERTPMVCDHAYGWLVPDGTATQQQPGA